MTAVTTEPTSLQQLLLDYLTNRPQANVEEVDKDEILRLTGLSSTLFDIIEREGLITPSSHNPSRYDCADVSSIQAASLLLQSGLPLGELLAIARIADQSLGKVAEVAVETFANFIRDRIQAETQEPAEVTEKLAEALAQILPATEQLLVQHFYRQLLAAVQKRS